MRMWELSLATCNERQENINLLLSRLLKYIHTYIYPVGRYIFIYTYM